MVSPNAVGKEVFMQAIKKGKSGIKYHKLLADLKFSCQVAGTPLVNQKHIDQYFTPLEQRELKATGLIYGGIAGLEAWQDAGLTTNEEANPDQGIIFGTGILGVDKLKEAFDRIDAKNVRRLGSQSVIQTMASGVTAFLNQKIGFGNRVLTNSSACATGTEALILGYEHIKSGKAKTMLVGSSSDSGPYIWGGFDALRILPHQYNENAEAASRPFAENAAGFVPASGAGALVIEDLNQAKKRGAKIYAEVLGGEINSGGQRIDGSMTAPNSIAVVNCIKKAVNNAKVNTDDIDSINAHLTATKMDSKEIENWNLALARDRDNFPYINSLKGMTGHGLAACGSIELVACVLQLSEGFLFRNLNAEPIHPNIKSIVSEDKIPIDTLDYQANNLVKASFGFGDVNACVVLKKYSGK